MKQKIGVITASGIGDGLILHIASHHLVEMGHEVITFNDHLAAFGAWFRGYSFAQQPPIDQIGPLFSSFHAIILQHDNTPKAHQIRALDLPVYTFFGSHQTSKHGTLRNTDYVADPNRTMVDNVQQAMAQWFGAASQENGMTPPDGLVHRKYPSRIAIHPSSGSEHKNWPQRKFYHVAKELQNMGYDPLFLAEPGGRPVFPSLESLASCIYESGAFLGNDSGPGHIASYLRIPSLIIGKDERQMRLWRPGWMPPEVLTPPHWSARWRWTRGQWKRLITTRRVINTLKHRVL